MEAQRRLRDTVGGRQPKKPERVPCTVRDENAQESCPAAASRSQSRGLCGDPAEKFILDS
jgi:hypothetical protein